MANRYYFRSVAEMLTLNTIDDVVKKVRSILTAHADSPDVISGGLHIFPTTVVSGGAEWSRHYAPPSGQTAPEPGGAPPSLPESDVFTATHRHKKTGGLYRLLGFATHTEDEQDVAIYQGEDGRFWARPKAIFEDGRFEELPTNG